MSKRIEQEREGIWASVTQHANKEGGDIGPQLPALQQGRCMVFIQLADANRNKYATDEGERSWKEKRK